MKQVPTYARAEEIKSGFFVGIAYTDEELSAASKSKVHRAAALVSEKIGVEVKPLIIDARRKPSASKVRMNAEERSELRRVEETDNEQL